MMQRQNRRITEQERTWLIQGLATLPARGRWKAAPGTGGAQPEDPARYLAQLDDLRVVGMCGCGKPHCHTVHFQHRRRGFEATLVVDSSEGGRMLIVCVDRETDLLAELEVS